MKNRTMFAKSLFALGALFVCAAPLLAQTPTKAPQTAPLAGRQRRPMRDLNLTPTQKAQMKTIMKNARAQHQALRGNTALTPAQKKTQSREIAKNTMAQTKAILTPQQLAKLKAERAANSRRGTAK